jgi:hypothetical protein
MANAATAADHVTLNLGEGGAVIATDFVNNNTDFGYGSGIGNAHFQVVKLSTGEAGQYALLSNSAPAPVRVWQIGETDVSNGFIAVRGNTVGDQAVPVSLSGATLTVSDITIIGGTIDQIAKGVSADIRSIKAGITLSVVGIDNNSVAVTGDVEVGKGISADIRSMPLPTGMTAFSTAFKSNQLYSFAGYTLESGVKVKNYFSGLEGLTPGQSGPGGGLLCVGYTGALAAGASTGFLLAPGEEVFIEIKNLNNLLATSVKYEDSNSLWVNMTILGT